MCDDVEKLVAALKARGLECGPVLDRGWGFLTEVSLPGGGKLGIYEPRHARPEPMRIGKAKAKAKAARPARRKSARPKAKVKPKRR